MDSYNLIVHTDIEGIINPRGEDLTDALMTLIDNRNEELGKQAFYYLYFLSKHCSSVRKAIATKYMSQLNTILSIRHFEQVDNDPWILAMSTVLNVVHDDESKLLIPEDDVKQIRRAIQNSVEAEDAILQVGMAVLADSLNIKTGLANVKSESNEKMIYTLLDNHYKDPLRSYQSGASLTSVIVMSFITIAYSKARWFYPSLRHGLDFNQTKAFMKNSRSLGTFIVGMYLVDFLLFKTQPFLSPSRFEIDEKQMKPEIFFGNDETYFNIVRTGNRHLQYLPVNNISLLDAMAIFQTAIFSASALYIYSQRRYILLPLLIASRYNHRKDKD